MSFLTTALLCIMCFILSFRVTNQQRSLTDIMCMGKRYRRHNKIMAAGALEVIKTDSGHLALKVDTQGSKDFVAIRLSRKEAKHFKAVLAACDGEPLNVSVCQYKVGGKKYFILYDKNADKKVPIELNGPKEETVKSNCKTVRSAAFAIFIFSPLLHTISPAISIVMILTATILVLLNIPFLPNSEWEKMCEFIKRPQTVQQSSEVNTDIVQSAASIALQEIMDKYGLPEGAKEDKSPEIAAQAKPEIQGLEKEKSSAQSNIEVKKQTEPQQEEVLDSVKADALKQDESIDIEIPTGFAEKSKEIPKQNQTQKAEPPVLEDVQLEDAESIKDEISLTDDVELEAEEDDSLDTLTSLGAEDSSETDVAALDEELKELEALNAAPTSFAAFNPEDDEKIDESEEFDIASMMGEPVDSEQDSTDVELGVEPETKMDELPYVELEEVLEAPIEEPPKSKAKQVRKSKKETAPAPPSENAFHVKMPAVSEEDGVQPKAEQKPIEKEVPKEESDSKPKKKATTPKRNRAAGDTSPFGRGFQDRTKSGTGKSRKKTAKKEETPADTGQMSFDEATTGVIECKVNEP
jgi:hypothetical protein